MRALPTVLIALAAFIVGALTGRFTAGGPSGASKAGVAGKGGAAKPGSSAGSGGGPPPPAAKPSVTMDGYQFQGMDFDTSPTFSHPNTTFPASPKIFFRLRLKDVRVPVKGKKPNAALTYRRLGKTEKQNGPMRTLSDEDFQKAGPTGDIIGYRPGLTFMSNPPPGETAFEIYVDGQPLGRASFTVAAAAAKPVKPGTAKPGKP